MNSIKVDQAISQQILQILSKASLETLKAGDVLQGRVKSLENSMLLLKLLDGTYFTAKVPDGFSMPFGGLVTLEIGESVNDQLTARIISQENLNNTVNKTTEHSLSDSIKQNLVSYGAQKVDGLVSGMLELIKAEPNIPLNQASFIVANGMSPDTDMLRIVKQISENEFQLHDNLLSLKEGLLKAFERIDDNLRNDILKPLVVSQELEVLASNLEKIVPEESLKIKHPLIQNVKELLTKTLLDNTNTTKETDAQSLIDQKAIGSIVENLINRFDGEGKNTEVLKNNMDTILKAVQKAVADIHIHEKELHKPESGNAREILEKLFDKAVIRCEDGAVKDSDIKEKALALKEIMEFSQKALSNLDSKAIEVNTAAFKEIDNVFRFFNQVSTYDSMIQIPLKINKEDATGELFVMKRKKGRKKLDPENFTLFMSLNTINLGRVESFLNASSKYVTINFRVEEEGLIKLIKENHRALYDGLLKKGYKLAEMKCRILEDKTNLLNAEQKATEFLGLQASLDLKI